MIILYIIMLGEEIFELFIASGHKEIATISAESDRNEANRIIDSLDKVMKESGFSLSDLDGVCVAFGLGSFTSNRFGAITANTLAYVLNIPVLGFDARDVCGNFRPALKSSMIERAVDVFSSGKISLGVWVDPSYESAPRINVKATS